ncbi:hypothetical protein [Methylobacterium sp. CM6247]
MSDNLSLTMRVTAHDDASPVLKKIAGEIDRLNDKLRKTVGDAKRAASGSVTNGPNQRKTTSTSDFARETADAAKALKAKFNGLNKIGVMARQRLNEERLVASEQARNTGSPEIRISSRSEAPSTGRENHPKGRLEESTGRVVISSRTQVAPRVRRKP